MLNSESRKKLIEQTRAARLRRKKSARIGGDAAEQRKLDDRDSMQRERYRTLVENIPCAVYSAFPGETGPTTFMSNKWKDWTGYSPEELYQDPEAWPKCIHPDDRETALNTYARACRDEAPYNLEYRVVHTDTRQVRYVADQGLLGKDKEGVIIRVDGIVTDITELKEAENGLRRYRDHLEELVKERTAELSRSHEVLKLEDTERKQAEEELKVSEEKFRTMFELSPYSTVLSDLEGNIMACNQQFAKMHATKKGPQTQVGRSVSEFFPKEEWPVLFSTIEKTIAERKNQGLFEFTMLREDGTKFPAEASSTIVVDRDGQPQALLAIAHDITHRKQAEQALRDSEEKYRQLFETEMDAIMIFDAETREFLDVNDAAVRLYGYQREEFLNLTQTDITAEEEASDTSIRQMAVGHPTGIPIRYHKKKDGTVFPVEISGSSFVLNDRKVMCGVVRDITERKKAEEELRQYDHIVSSSSDMMALLDKRFTYLAANTSYLKIFKKTRDEVIGHTAAEVFGKEFFETVIKPNAERCLAGEEVNYQAWFDFPASESRYMDVKYYPYVDANNEVLGFVVNGRNITERKQVGERLEQESIMRSTLLDNLPCIAMILKKQSREIVASNEAARKVGAVPGKTCYGTCAGRENPCPFCHAPEVWATDEPRQLEVEYRERHYEGIWVPLTEDMYVHYIFDITERKEAEQRILDDRAQLKSLASQLSLTEERERRRLATELHDQIGQSLVISKIKLDQLRKSSSSGGLTEALEEVCNCLGQVIDDTRTLTFDLSSPILYELGFEAAVAEWFAEQIRQKHGIETEFEDDGQQKPLDEDIRTILFRNVRELLINVVKHAQATRVKVSIRRADEDIHVSVEDDGVGFDPVEVASMAAKRAEFGLFSIRERLEQLDGHLEIESEPGRGAKILMTAPLKYKNVTDGTEV
ncbi:MAG: sensor histidine kinase [Planctomycetota bacterium]|jgi:PAS domain S-box-containing protein